MDLGGKKLVVKVDAKTKTVLDEYKGTVLSAIIEVNKQYKTQSLIFKYNLINKNVLSNHSNMNSFVGGVSVYFILQLIHMRGCRLTFLLKGKNSVPVPRLQGLKVYREMLRTFLTFGRDGIEWSLRSHYLGKRAAILDRT
jgi:hypothetical protein